MESITTIPITDIPWNMGAREFNLMFKFHNGFMSGRLTDVYSHRGKTGWATFLSVECANIAIHVLNDLYVGDRHFLRVDWANKNLKATSRNSRSTSAQTWQTSEQTWQTSEHAWQTSTWQWNPDMEDSGTQAWQPWTPTPEPGIPTQTWNPTYAEPAANKMPKKFESAAARRQASAGRRRHQLRYPANMKRHPRRRQGAASECGTARRRHQLLVHPAKLLNMKTHPRRRQATAAHTECGRCQRGWRRRQATAAGKGRGVEDRSPSRTRYGRRRR
jgi:hypothetical protein